MPQNTTILPTGTRAFNAVTADAVEATAILVLNGDGGQLALEEIDGVAAGAVTVRAYAVNTDGTTGQVYQFLTPTGNFNQTIKGGAYDNVDEFTYQKISLKGAIALGLFGAGGLKITVQAVGPTAISLGATLDRRVDGPI